MTRSTIFGLIFTITWAIASVAQTSTQFTSLATHSPNSRTRPFTANEPHIQSETLGALYANSAFAHGYRHGYEQGFHLGDLYVHMGRDAQVGMTLKDAQPRREYDPSFGSKLLFQGGYKAGFRGGYADAVSGAEFRATERMKAAAAGLTNVLPNAGRAHFDEGVAAGYNSAQSASAPVTHVNAEYVEQYCRQTLTNPYSLEYCSGFGHGYVLGISTISPDSISMATSQKVVADRIRRPRMSGSLGLTTSVHVR